jgi:hypothetical protein
MGRTGWQSGALAWLVAFMSALVARPAFACGVSGADGAWSCSLEEHDEAERPRWSVGVAGLSTWTELKFDDLHARQQRNAIVATAAYAPLPRLRFQVSAGAAFAGELRAPNGTHEFSVGPTGAAGIVYTLIEGRPFVALSGVVSASHATTQLRGRGPSVNYDALDLRLGLIAGTTVFDILSPYLVARAFGGPVFWHYENQAQVGTDIAHYQIGAGVALRPIEAIAVFVEGVPLGERALSGGASIAF